MEREVHPELKALKKLAGSSLVWPLLAVLVIALLAAHVAKLGRVDGDQVGILLNKITGETEVINQSGVRIYNGITHDFYVLDKTIQTLDMTERTGRGDRLEKDDLKIKTIDGSDVYVDLKVLYSIDPVKADVVIASSGPGDNYMKKWARDYTRSICRNHLGELTTEEFYDSTKRKTKIVAAKQEINERLKPFGLMVSNIVIPQKPHFYKEYEDMIKKKKLADQAVLEEQSKALAAKQSQQTQIVQATNIKNVAVEQFTGKMEQKIIVSRAEGEKVRKAADAYYDQVTIGSAAKLYERKKQAEGILAIKQAEAKGIEAMKKALEGEGGRNMVKMEYAKRLRGIKFDGKPFAVDGKVEKIEHSKPVVTFAK
jgi:regulator of protease activity HflC (stomatin/prohibitin superfamily)